MTNHPKNSNPLSKNPHSVYEELGIEPSASEAEISVQLEKAMANIATLSDEERGPKTVELQELITFLKNRRKRVQVNALILDHIDARTIQNRLKNLPNLASENIQLPEPSLAQVLMEGVSNELVDLDFPETERDADLQIAAAEVAELQRQRPPRHVTFDN
jgi:hypothetical protein